MKERKQHIDIAKGILILLVVMGHLPLLQMESPYKSEVLAWIENINRYYVPFYMAAFFLITGYCSNFKRNFKDFLIRNTKSILIPGLCFSILVGITEIYIIPYSQQTYLSLLEKVTLFGGLFWFLTALFIAKIIFFFINKTPQKNKTINYMCIVYNCLRYKNNIFNLPPM